MRGDASERPASAGERCTCGRQATVVFVTEAWGEVGWCGRSDGGRRGRCVFCGDPAGHTEELCPLYTLCLDDRRPDPGPGPEAA